MGNRNALRKSVNRYKINKSICLLAFILLDAYTIFAVLFNKHALPYTIYEICIFSILNLIAAIILCNVMDTEKLGQAIPLVSIFMIQAIMAGVASSSCSVYIAIAMMVSVITFILKHRRLFIIHIIETIVGGLILLFYPSIDYINRLEIHEIAGVFVCLVGVDVIFDYVLRANLENNDLAQEREATYAETLKIVEAKADEARVATKSKTDFLTSMSHELRTPINSIMGMNEMIRREATDANIQSYSREINNSGSALLSLVGKILDFSVIESGKMSIKPVAYDLSSLLNDVIIANKAMADGKDLSFGVIVDENIPALLVGDDVRIKQVIDNLLSNAIKFTQKGTVELLVGYKKIDEKSISLVVSVSDTGIGLKEEDIKKMFSAFDKVDDVKNRHENGAGLGMNITQQLLALMGSQLYVDSKVGEGSKFTFSIGQNVTSWNKIGSFGERYKPSDTEESDPSESFIAPEARVLAVDDIPVNLNVIVNLLGRTQVKVDTATSGKEALDLARKEKYNVILMDHMMPEMDGIETLEKMRRDRFCVNRNTPAVVVTANAVSGARESYMEKGFDDYMSKPVNPRRLENIVARYIPDDLKQIVKIDEAMSNEASEEIYNIINDVRNMGHLDVDGALVFTATEENYVEVLRDFTITAQSRIDMIKGYYDDLDIHNYTIQVHALKNTAKLIGDMEFSESAKALEMAGNDNNIEYIKEKTESVLARYDELYRLLLPIFSKEDDNRNEIDTDFLRNRLEDIKSAVEEFDFDKVEAIVAEIGEYSMPEKYIDAFNRLKVLVADVALDEIPTYIDTKFII